MLGAGAAAFPFGSALVSGQVSSSGGQSVDDGADQRRPNLLQGIMRGSSDKTDGESGQQQQRQQPRRSLLEGITQGSPGNVGGREG